MKTTVGGLMVQDRAS